MPGRLLLVSLALFVTSAGAAPGTHAGKRQTLWDALAGPDDPTASQAAQPELLPPPPPRPHERTPAQELIDRLRQASPDEDRTAIVAELARRGGEGEAALAEALDREELLLEVLRDARRGSGPATPARTADAPWVEAKYRLARDRFLAGDHYGALRLIDAIFALEPDTPLTSELRRLQRRARDEALRASLVLAELSPAAPVITSDGPLEVSVTLRNQAEQPVSLATDGADQPIGVVSVDFEELLPDGARTRIRSQRPVLQGDDELVLRPGQTVSLRVSMPSPHRELRPGAVGRYRLGGRLRPTRLQVGELGYGASIPLLPVQVLVVAGEDRPLAEAPARAFVEAVAEARAAPFAVQAEPARRAFVAALLWGASDASAALAATADALRTARGPLSDALCATMGRLTGEPLTFSRSEWLAWWAGHDDRPRHDPPSREE